MNKHPDFLIIGAGVVGLTLSLEIKKNYPDSTVIVLEKEKQLAAHGSGRNSGVLHAGFYYTKSSLKARFCRDGNQAMTNFCEEHDLPLKKCGKLVVAKNEEEIEGLNILLQRGQQNEIALEKITAAQARGIEPQVKTCEYALWSPTTSTIDPRSVINTLAQEARSRKISIQTETRYLDKNKDCLHTSQGKFYPGYVINAAGLYADKIAKNFGFASNLNILPFKGLYLYKDISLPPINTHIYPVPDLNYPFLGVHFTLTVDGHTKIGPTAIPAFWRENYSGLQNFSWQEFMETVSGELKLMLHSDFDFKYLALTEIRKRFRSILVSQAGNLMHGVQKKDFKKWGKPGIRAQLYDTRQKKMIMDFCTQGDNKSFHVLNAVSPALTASFPFSSYCCEQIKSKLSSS